MEDEIRELIEDYQLNKSSLNNLQHKLLELLEYNTKLTASYSLTAVSGGDRTSRTSSKVERHALRIHYTEQQLLKVANSLAIVDNAQKVLNNKENEVINLIKRGYRNKLTRIAEEIGSNKKYVFDTRNRAIKKMCEYIKYKQ